MCYSHLCEATAYLARLMLCYSLPGTLYAVLQPTWYALYCATAYLACLMPCYSLPGMPYAVLQRTWYALCCASAMSFPRAVTPSTRPPADTSSPAALRLVPA